MGGCIGAFIGIMKPGDHPDFFRRPPPEGRSRESSIRLDKEGRFWHDGALVEHAGMTRAFASWIGRHPDDGRFVLNNGYDWSYFEVEDVPFFVVRVHGLPSERSRVESVLEIELSDGSREPLNPAAFERGTSDALTVRVKNAAYRARFTRSAQLSLAPLLMADENGAIFMSIGSQRWPVPNADGT